VNLSIFGPPITAQAANAVHEISILSWNLDGSLAACLLNERFQEIIVAHHIILIQETHLAHGQEGFLHIPEGCSMLSHPRHYKDDDDHPRLSLNWGGVAVIFRDHLNISLLKDLCGPDFMAFSYANILVFNAYVIPHNTMTDISLWSEEDPWESLQDRLAHALGGNAEIIVFVDANARTGSLSPREGPPRDSIDVGVPTKRGRELVNVCDQLQLAILNGAENTPGTHSGWTSFQSAMNKETQHCSVIDYCLASQTLLPSVISFDVIGRTEWSDHSPLSLLFQCPEPHPPSLSHHTPLPIRIPFKFPPLCSRLDKMVESLVDNAKLPVEGATAIEQPPAKVSRGDRRATFMQQNNRGRWSKRKTKDTLLTRLEKNADDPADFWKFHKRLTKPCTHKGDVTASDLFSVFVPRMNPPDPESSGFDPAKLAEEERKVSSIPDVTEPSEAFPELGKLFTIEDVAELKGHLSDKARATATGLDRTSRDLILAANDDELRKLLNECLLSRDAPGTWLTTLVVGVPKRGKTVKDVKNYRTIALESCLLKAMTYLIHRKFLQATELAGIVPPSQNGFKPKCCTNDNPFILRTLIDQATAQGQTLYTAFVDISNAFPSTNHSSLWNKLYAAGLTGHYFDWLQMLYTRMSYIISHDGELSDKFRSLAGVLIGDPLSRLCGIFIFLPFDWR